MSHERTTATIERRELLKLAGAAAAGMVASSAAAAGKTMPALPANPATAAAMPTRNLGRTGYQVGIFSLGGQAALEKAENQAVAVPLIERAVELGVNYIDTSARYGGEARWSERHVGEAMKKHRARVYLASKTHDRTRDGSMKLLEKSLELLNTDHLDLWQLHAVSTAEDVARIFAPGGAIEALTAARERGLVRHLGITGHTDPAVLLEAIRRFPFDTILMAVNAADRYRLPFAAELLPAAVEKEMGIIGMKIPSRGRLLSSWTPPPPEQRRPSDPKEMRPGTMTMREAMRWVLSLPVSTVIVGCDTIAQLEENVAIARAFTPMSATQMETLASAAEPVGRQALFYRRWEA
jgi:uncharacterized protein